MPVSMTGFMAWLPKPKSLTFSYPKEWSGEEGQTSMGKNIGAKMIGMWEDVKQNVNSDYSRGVAANQFEKILFKNLPYRQMTFEWSLVPKNAGQASLYQTFMDFMKKSSAPKLAGASYWEYPETFSLEISAGSNVIFKSPNMACTNIIINHTPSGFWTQHKDKTPVAIEFQLEFTELEWATKDKIGGAIV